MQDEFIAGIDILVAFITNRIKLNTNRLLL